MHTLQQNKKKDSSKNIITIPNLLSCFRLALIPLIVWLYCFKQSFGGAAVALIVSGLSDIVDGYIARRFNMVSDLGKALDPIADKLTQIAMLACLVTRFSFLLLPLTLLIFKESTSVILRSIILKKTGKVQGAVWHGKLNTVLIYSVIFLHIMWYNIPAIVSQITIIISTAVMILSCVLYTMENVKFLNSFGGDRDEKA